MSKRTDAEIVNALRDARGLVTVAARKLRIDRQTIYNRLKVSEKVAEALAEARDFTTDVAEAKLFQAIESGEAWAVCFYLKCQAKDRGYVERIDHAHGGSDGGPIEMVVTRKVVHAGKNRIAEHVNGANGNGARP